MLSTTSEQELSDKSRTVPAQTRLIAQPEPKRVNLAGFYARRGLKSEISRCDARLQTDLASILQGHCIYLPGFFAPPTDFSLLQALTADLAKNTEGGMVNWSQHLKHDNPDFSLCFKGLLERMATFFDVEVYATRLNFYPDASSWKPYHHDSHAYGGRQLREDFTMGASFGFERKLSFLHPDSGETFEFPQMNGDIFAFTTEANKRFQHGVPKCKTGKSGPRFSIIAWGRRRTINERNAASDELMNSSSSQKSLLHKPFSSPSSVSISSSSASQSKIGNVLEKNGSSTMSTGSNKSTLVNMTDKVGRSPTGTSSQDVAKASQGMQSLSLTTSNSENADTVASSTKNEAKQHASAAGCGCGDAEEGNAVVMHSQEVSRLVDQFVAPSTAVKANPWASNKSRVQGGWANKSRGGGGSRVR